MQRRKFLTWGGALSLSTLFNTNLLSRAMASGRTQLAGWCRARPGSEFWPSEAQWAALNQAVNGKLIKVASLFAPCVKDAESEACKDLRKNMRNPFYLGDQPGGTQVCGWFNAWEPAPSAYAIHAQDTADIVAGVRFAEEHDLRLVIKGTGHSYQGTSNAPDSLLIWTRAMKQVTLHDQFIPEGGTGLTEPVAAVSAQSGCVWIDLYHAVTSVGGRYVQGGGCADVGVAGLIQSGGFGSMSKGFGTAASGLLEAEVVVSGGKVLVVNAHQNSDLFWALKGGGGGSWGVVTRVTLKTHELPEFFGAAWGKIKAKSDDAYRRLIDQFMHYYAEHLFNPHWGEQVHFGPDNTFNFGMICQGLSQDQVRRDWQPFFDWITARPKDYAIVEEMGTFATKARGWWNIDGNDSMIPDNRPGSPAYYGWWKDDGAQVGVYIHGYDSLWMPAILLKPAERKNLVDAIFLSSRHKKMEMQFNKGLAGARPDVIDAARNTATNPAVCSAFALVIIADGESSAYPGQPDGAIDVDASQKDARAIELAVAALKRVAPNAGSYVSESNYFNPNWQQAFWGENYPRLLSIKNKYDPAGLFFVRHGVGSEQWSEDGFVRVDHTT